MTVLYPSDGTCTYRLMEIAANHKGMVYLRTGRPKSPVLYGPEERFHIGGCKVLRHSANDVLTIVAAGVTLFEALKAHDQLKAKGVSVRGIDLYSIVPIDRTTRALPWASNTATPTDSWPRCCSEYSPSCAR